ncbi:OmpA family protein [Streptomyces sp. NPDC005571]|uniref:OmpA family protein n=1 Tax=Streptomyces sp. NPDC005571 TaxID=3156888 RepID=UPI0033BA33EC
MGVTVAATATSAEAAPALPDVIKQELRQTASAAKQPGDATVRLLVGGAAAQPFTADLAPLRTKGVIEHGQQRHTKIDENLAQFDAELATARSRSQGEDLLGLIDRAARTKADADLVVISSGISTADPVDFRKIGFSGDPKEVAADLRNRHLLPDLANRRVSFAGLGQTAGGQPPLPLPARDYVEQVWKGVCELAGAAECRVIDEIGPVKPPTATAAVPRVPVPTIATRPGPRPNSEIVSIPDPITGFTRDSARLSPAADDVLRPLADEIASKDLRVDVVGHVADVGPGHGMDLSRRRAEAVARRLVALGVPDDAIGSVIGRGDLHNKINNWTHGHFDEAKAVHNRIVEITTSPSTPTH